MEFQFHLLFLLPVCNLMSNSVVHGFELESGKPSQFNLELCLVCSLVLEDEVNGRVWKSKITHGFRLRICWQPCVKAGLSRDMAAVPLFIFLLSARLLKPQNGDYTPSKAQYTTIVYLNQCYACSSVSCVFNSCLKPVSSDCWCNFKNLNWNKEQCSACAVQHQQQLSKKKKKKITPRKKKPHFLPFVELVDTHR